MKTLEIHYQTNRRSPEIETCYYPEDNRTPRQRVDYVLELKKQDLLMEPFILYSACPYIIEAFVKYFKDAEIKCFIDDNSVDILDIFKEMATPMQDLNFID